MTYSGERSSLACSDRHPDLHRIRKELGLLQKLYGSYNDVIKTVNATTTSVAEVDIVDQRELLEFGNRCRVAEGTHEWPAFEALRDH